MCGIVGARHDWLLARGLDPAAAMQGAIDSLRWRGPDGAGVVRVGAWWLGCARLAIGPKNSRQPLVRRGGRFACVMNGAITNARELWARLMPGVEKRTQLPNDAWLPLLAVERGDAGALVSLRGHHAYAVVDVASGELVLGQDRFGEKPLQCMVERTAERLDLVAFTSTPGALRPFGVPAASSPRRVAEWFRCGWAEPRPFRFSTRSQVTAVPTRGVPLTTNATSWCEPWRSDSVRTWRPAVPASLRAALLASVARCVDTRVPVALSLSGGLDSSCLAIALHALGRSAPAYQLRAEGARADERDAARAVAARAGLAWRPVDVGRDVLDALPHLTACAGAPLGDPSILAVHAVARAAAADSVRVLLGGEGADELFLGYRRYHALATLPHAAWLRALAPRWSMRYPARWLRAAAASDPVLALLAVTPPAFGEAVLAPDLAARRAWRDEGEERVRGSDAVLAARARDVGGYLRCDLLPKVDVGCMAAGVEARCPYLEGDFAAFAATRNALGKRPLRDAFASDLPREVLALPKTGFALPLDRWFRGELAWLDLLAEPRTQQRPHLRPGGVAKAVAMHRSGKVNIGHGLYLLVACELFLRWREQEIPAARGTIAPRSP